MNKLTKLLGSELMATDTFVRAITHRSAEGKHNERMEFLGDSVLGLIITTELYQRIPRASEGYLSRLRASLVNENALAGIAAELAIGDFLRLGPGELKSGGFRRKSIIADAFEALVGCIYLEQGMEMATTFVLTAYGDRLDNLPAEDTLKDPKSR
ncbi:ribonuclease III family protein, partial [Thiothrix litoralis]|uniref:ribonuclease III family protein n=1 Tax=Thiothrix litoralis TaxID=2891210 RepID=UPI003C77711C